ncbi:MAG: hypothetical protein ACUVS7_05025 [Bryobacteraceae bacterium]
MHRAVVAATLLLASAGCRQARHPDPSLTIEEPAALRAVIDTTNPADEGQLLDGFYTLDPSGWRWSAPQFTITLGVPEELRGRDARLEFELIVPDAAAKDLEGLTITARVGDHELPAWRSRGAGAQTAVFPVPAAVLNEDGIVVDFTLDRFVPPRGAETRRLGVIPRQFRLVAANTK